jgi:hypothetical protein
MIEPWQRMVLDCLEALASHEQQEIGWLAAKASLPDAIELLSMLFEDSALEYLLERGPVFSAETDELLRMVDAAVDQVDLQQSPARLLQDEDWFKVQKAAEKALQGVRRDLKVEG